MLKVVKINMSFLVKGSRNWKPEAYGKLENSQICKNSTKSQQLVN